VPGCGAGCHRVFTVSVPAIGNQTDGGHLDGMEWTGPDYSLTGQLVYWVDGKIAGQSGMFSPDPREGQGPIAGACHVAGEGPDSLRCVVTGHAGAHGSGAVLLTLNRAQGIHILDSVNSGSASVALADLNHDGFFDVALRESTDIPDHASAPQYWQTFLDQDGRFSRTGCTKPTTDNTPAPTAPVTGTCPR